MTNREEHYRENRYRTALAAIPPPGYGEHSHDAIFFAACCGIEAAIPEEAIFSDIRAAIAIKPGRKPVTDGKIREAIRSASKHTAPMVFDGNARKSGSFKSFRAAPPPKTEAEEFAESLKNEAVAKAVFRETLEAGGENLDPWSEEVWESSPIRINPPIFGDMLPLLEHLYNPDDLLFIGKQTDKGEGHIKPAAEWLRFFRCEIRKIESLETSALQVRRAAWLGSQYPLIMPNPLTGEKAMTKSGNPSLRADSCVKEFRYLIAEGDTLPLPQQCALIRGICRNWGFKVAALIHSGNKSLHAWLCCEGVHTLEDWESVVKKHYFALLKALKFDDACSQASHLSRLPGAYRLGTRDENVSKNKYPWGKWQKLFYLAPEGGCL